MLRSLIFLVLMMLVHLAAAYPDETAAHRSAGTHALTSGSTFAARDTLQLGDEPSEDARRCLHALAWSPSDFQVVLEKPVNGEGDWLIRFPSARPSGDAINDLAAMEWYQARDANGQSLEAPAVVVVHESGSGMTVGRLIAKSLQASGVHALMLQLPYYGVRRGLQSKPRGERVVEALKQSIADARRAKDAVSALPLIDSKRISLQGTSLGGFVAATAAGLDDAYQNVFILLAGGDLYGVVMEGKQDAAKVREELLQAGVNSADLKRMLNDIEPLRLAHRLVPQRTWLYSGSFDDVVPPRHAELLASAAGLDVTHHVKLLATHYSGIIFLPFITLQMSQQMQR